MDGSATTSNKVGRPPGSKQRSAEQRLAELTDRTLIRVMRGIPAFHADGKPLLDANGRQVMKPPTASHLRAAVARLASMHSGAAPRSPASRDLEQELHIDSMVKEIMDEERARKARERLQTQPQPPADPEVQQALARLRELQGGA